MVKHYNAVVRTWRRYYNNINPEAVGTQCGRVARHFPLAHFGVVALKRVAMRQVARKMDPEFKVQLQREFRYTLISL